MRGGGILNKHTNGVVKDIREDIQPGESARRVILGDRAGAPTLSARRRITGEHQIVVVGEKLRAMMPCIKANELVDKSRN